MTAAKPWHLLPLPRCIVCGCVCPRGEHDSERVWRRRQVCSRAHDRVVKMTQAEKGRASWGDESARSRRTR